AGRAGRTPPGAVRRAGAGAAPAAGGGRAGPVAFVPRPAGPRRGRVEAAWFAADDPGPFVAMLAAFAGRGAGKAARVLRGFPEQGRRTALAAPPAAPPEAPAEPDELVTR
ncbi:ATP-grasp domain-containing protein, partial [Streptomyces sp. NPDC059656]